MFTEQVSNVQKEGEKEGKKLLTTVEGVDVSRYHCYELKSDDSVYKNFNNSNIHYAIGAMQKGVKPPTKIGLKRLHKRALNKKIGKCQQNSLKFGRLGHRLRSKIIKPIEQTQQIKAKSLNPLSTEQICLKSLRTKFREQMQNRDKQIDPIIVEESSSNIFTNLAQKIRQRQKRIKNRKAKFIRKKENQRKRRDELIYLVTEYGQILKNIFPAQRLKPFNKKTICPMIRRQEIKDALTKYFQSQIQLFQSQERMNECVSKKFEERKKKQEQNEQKMRHFRYLQDSEYQSSSSSSSSSSSHDCSSSSPSYSESGSQSQQRKLVKLD